MGITYDAIGNPLNDGTWTYTWQAGRQLASMNNASTGVTMEFKYDHNGLRTQKVKKVNGVVTETTNYQLHGKLITHLTKGTNSMHFYYDAQSRPAMVNFNGTTYSYVHNLQGDIVGMLNSAGNLVVEYKYDPWGQIIGQFTLDTAYDTLAEVNPFRYRGYVWDQCTTLYYLEKRYYSPLLARFLIADLIIPVFQQSFITSVFAYCGNSPILHLDESGFEHVGITIFINPNADNILYMICNKEFGHVELSIQNDGGTIWSYSYGRYRNYESFGTSGEGIFIVDNYQHSVQRNKSERNIYRYELDASTQEIQKMLRYVDSLCNGKECIRSDVDVNGNYRTQHNIDRYSLFFNNCTTKAIEILQSGCGDRVPKQLFDVITPMRLFNELEELYEKKDPFIIRKYRLK